MADVKLSGQVSYYFSGTEKCLNSRRVLWFAWCLYWHLKLMLPLSRLGNRNRYRNRNWNYLDKNWGIGIGIGIENHCSESTGIGIRN